MKMDFMNFHKIKSIPTINSCSYYINPADKPKNDLQSKLIKWILPTYYLFLD